jgi:pilus assembly protein CpaF
MRPDRIIIGECRGGEALDLLQALNTGHAGSMSTIHANSPRDALARLEVLTLLSGIEIPISAIRSQIASAFDLVVQIVRSYEGKRTISAVSELGGLEGGSFRMQDIFRLDAPRERETPRYALCTGVPACLRDRASQESEHILQIFSQPEGTRTMHAVSRPVRASPGL